MKKVGLLCLAVVLALGTVGVGYAMWDKTVYIDGTIEAGEVNLRVLSASSDDPPGAIDPGKDKDVGSTTVQIDPLDDQRIIVTVTNAYPCYEVYVHFTVRNNGTIPVKLQGIIITAPVPYITVEGWNSIGEQIDPGENRNNTIYIHVEQEAEELETYTFLVEFHYVQWNEYSP
jgi:hypothetical protein